METKPHHLFPLSSMKLYHEMKKDCGDVAARSLVRKKLQEKNGNVSAVAHDLQMLHRLRVDHELHHLDSGSTRSYLRCSRAQHEGLFPLVRQTRILSVNLASASHGSY